MSSDSTILTIGSHLSFNAICTLGASRTIKDKRSSFSLFHNVSTSILQLNFACKKISTLMSRWKLRGNKWYSSLASMESFYPTSAI